MSFTKQELQSFRTDFAKAVAKLEKEYGVEIGLGNISYSAEQFTSKIKVAKTVSSNGQKTSETFVQDLDLPKRITKDKSISMVKFSN